LKSIHQIAEEYLSIKRIIMTINDLKNLLEIAKTASLEAGVEILKIYETGDFGIESKSDNSPLTMADKASHNIIVKHLQQTELPILSEEGKSIGYAERKDWEYFWMVDPLDGTKEFTQKNGQFTVNIALIHQGKVILGVVYPPVWAKLYFAIQGEGAYVQEGENTKPLWTEGKQNPASEITKILASKSHFNKETEDFIAQYPNAELVNIGSSLKFIWVAEGKAHIYPRIAPTMEWDTAAAQIIVEEAGGKVLQYESQTPVVYNKENLLNPYFVVYDRQ
jgi:3'(2'), 5'-bisphosphate nucleotidase